MKINKRIDWEFTCSCGAKQVIGTTFEKRTGEDKLTTKNINTSVFCDACKKITDSIDPRRSIKEEIYKDFSW